MNTRVLVMLSLLVAMGAVLHAVAPPILFGMRADMLLAMMFLGIMLFPRIKYVIILAIATGIMSALTTTVPGGEISNMIDKPITALAFFGLLLLGQSRINGHVLAPILTAVGTAISGSIFLTVALKLIGLLNGAFGPMFLSIVAPATVVNTIVMIVLYPVVKSIMRRQPITTS